VKVDAAAREVREATTIVANVAQVLAEQTQAVRELASGVSRAADSSKRAKIFIDETVREVDSSETVVAEQFSALEERQAAHYVLYRAKADHLLWKKRLAGLLSGLSSLDERQLSDHHSCRLGKWWDAQNEGALSALPAFRAIEEPHRLVHESGRLAARLHHQGDLAGARDAFDAMERASSDVVARLDELIKEVESR
jgi:methyl-accepting chemotaxis protein